MNPTQHIPIKTTRAAIVLAVFLSLWAINAHCTELSIFYTNDNHGEIEPCG